MLAGLYPRSSQPGESQIKIKLYPEPPKKMPTGLNNEHLTRKAFDYHHHGHNSLVFPGAHFAHIFALSREREGRRENTEYAWNQLRDRPARRTSVYPPPRISSHWESWCAPNNYHVNHKTVIVQSRPPLCNPIDCSISHQASLSPGVRSNSCAHGRKKALLTSYYV